MSKRPRRNHTVTFKAKVALAAIKGEKTLSELAEKFDVHANRITQWKSQLLEGAVGVFGGEAKSEPAAAAVDLKTLHVKIGALTLETSFCTEASEEALSKNEKPEVFNTDQESQFTSEAFTGRLKEYGISIGMDTKGRFCY